MSIDQDIYFCCSVDKYVSISVGGCWWPIYSRAIIMAVTFWYFLNHPPHYTYVADAITFLIFLHSKCNGKFSGVIDFIGVFNFGPRGKYPPALLRASGSEM